MQSYFDCHMHECHGQEGGFLIALDGRGGSSGGYSNREVCARAGEYANVIPVQYVAWDFAPTGTPIVKYHPRREGYTPQQVMADIEARRPQAVIFDTLDQPCWQPADYWQVARTFPQTTFLFSHMGGFDMLPFLNTIMFQKNVWGDFSFVQHYFGFCGTNAPFPQIAELMEYALRDERLYGKLLFGTDNMRGEQDLAPQALAGYEQYDSFRKVTYENYLRFLEMSGLQKKGEQI